MSISRSLLFQCTLPGRRSPRYLATIVPLRVLGVCPALCRVLPLFLIFSIAAHFACSPRPLYSPRRWIEGAPDPAYRPRDIPLLGSRSGPSCFLCLGFSSGPVRARPRRLAEPKGVFPAQFLPPRVTDTVTLAPPGRHRGQSCPLPPASVHFGRVQQAMSALTTRWTQILLALSSASALFVDCQASSNPPEHMARAIASNAPSTLERYFEQWISWCRHCDSAGCHPAAPPPGFLPDWLASRASAQGLATAPLKALAWMCQTHRCVNPCLPRCAVHFRLPLSEHRESLPLSLSFVVWLEQSVLDPSTSPAQVLRLDFVLVCVWASLRWGDSLWVPPARVQYQISVHALVGTSVRTNTTKRGMP